VREGSRSYGKEPSLTVGLVPRSALRLQQHTFNPLLAAGRAAFSGCLIFTGFGLLFVSLPANAQQPTKPISAPDGRPRTTTTPSKITANAPSKTSTTAPANPSTPASISSSSNDPQQLLAAGQAAQAQGRFEEAVRIYNRVIAL